jgi:hypothetical protein
MKVALCIHGQLRALNDTIIKYLNIPVDTYMHIWWDGKKRYDNVGLIGGEYSVRLPDNVLDILYDIYHPKKCILQEPVEFPMCPSFQTFERCQFSHVMPMLYSIQYALQLAHDHLPCENYDWYVKARLDILIHSPPIVFDALDPECVYAANTHTPILPDCTILIIPRKYISVFTNFWNNLDACGSYGIEEHVFKEILLKHNIPLRSVHLSYTHDRQQYRV